MADKKQKQNFNEHINRLKYKINYGINEAPIYQKITEDDFGMDDTLPDQVVQAEPQPVTANSSEAAPSGATTPEVPPAGAAEMPPPAEAGAMPEMGAQPEQSVDQVQNDIIRQNLSTMEMIHNKLEQLETMVQGLNQEHVRLNAEVEEVREPSNGEKLMSKKDVSYPFYYNLNDVWKDNWFEKNREQENEKGIRELPDGTFIADFDDLPEFSKTDIEQSFSKIT